MTPTEYLEFLQISTGIAQPGVFHPSLDIEETRARLKNHIDKIRRSDWGKYSVATSEEAEDLTAAIDSAIQDIRPHCSRYEDLGSMLVLTDLKRSIDQSLQDLDLGPFGNVTIGTLPSGEMNGLTIRVPGGSDYVIALNRGIFTFIQLASKVLVQSFPTSIRLPRIATLESAQRQLQFELTFGWRDIATIILSVPNPISRFRDLLLSYVVHGDPRRARPWRAAPEKSNLSAVLTHFMETFVMAHEAAHVVLKHSPGTKAFSVTIGNQTVETWWRDWQDEILADNLAYRITANVAERKGWPPLFVYIAVQYLFSIMECVDRARNLLESGRDEETTNGSHPPSSSRRLVIHSLTASENKEDLNKLVHRAIEQRTYFLWHCSKSAFFKARRAKLEQEETAEPIAIDSTMHLTSPQPLLDALGLGGHPGAVAHTKLPESPAAKTLESEQPDTTTFKLGVLSRRTTVQHVKLLTSWTAIRWFCRRVPKHVGAHLCRPVDLAASAHLRSLDAMTYSWMAVITMATVLSMLVSLLVRAPVQGVIISVACLALTNPAATLAFYAFEFGTVSYSVELLVITFSTLSLLCEMRGIVAPSLIFSAFLTTCCWSPLDVKWNKGKPDGKIQHGFVVYLIIAVALGFVGATLLRASTISRIRLCTLAGIVVGCAIVDVCSSKPSTRTQGLSGVMVFGAVLLLPTVAASLPHSGPLTAFFFLSAWSLAASGNMLAAIATGYSKSMGRACSIHEVQRGVPYSNAAMLLAGLVAVWTAILSRFWLPLGIIPVLEIAVAIVLCVSMCLLNLPRYLLVSVALVVVHAFDMLNAKRLGVTVSPETCESRVMFTDGHGIAFPAVISSLHHMSAFGIDRALHLLDLYSKRARERTTIVRVLRLLLTEPRHACRVFAWVIRCGWTAELIEAGSSSGLGKQEARLLFALGVVGSLPYVQTRALKIQSKGAVHEIQGMEVDNRGSLAWDIDRHLKVQLEEREYSSFSRLCRIVIALDGDNYRRLGTLTEELADVAADPLFARDSNMADNSTFSVLRDALDGLRKYADQRRDLTVSDRSWLSDQKEMLIQGEQIARNTVTGVAVGCVLTRLKEALN